MTDPRSRSNIHVGVKRNPPDLNPDSLHHDGSFGKYMQAGFVACFTLHICKHEGLCTLRSRISMALLCAGQEPQAARAV